MKRKLSLLVVLFSTLFAMAGRPFDGTEILYLKASAVDWWQNASAVQKATFDDTEVVVGVADANNSGYVGFTVPAGEYTTVKFSRHDPNGGGQWNATGNITIAAEGNCVMTFSDKGSDATWGTYDPGHVEVITYFIKTNWKDGGWGAGFKKLTVNDDGSQSMTETYTGNGFNISPNFLGTDWYPVEKLNLVGGVVANDLVTISVNPNATDQANVFTITKISSPEPEPELDPINVTVRVYTTAAAPKIWWWGGDIAGADATYTWEGRPSMNKEGETNWYSWTFEGVNATSGISYKITATTEKEFSGVKENKCLDANLEILDCSYEPEPEPEPEPETAPDHLYILGNIEGVDWTPDASAEMTKNGDIFTGTYTFTQATSYFAFTTVQGNWDDVNANRYHSSALTAGADPIALIKENGSSTIGQGTYTIIVDWANMTVAAEEVEPEPTLETNVYLAGTFNGWSTTSHNFVRQNLGDEVAYTTITGVSTTGDIEFKVVEGGKWCNAETQNITFESTSVTFLSDDVSGSQVKMTPYAAGDYVVAFNLTTRVLTVTYPAGEKMEETHEVALAGTFNSWGAEHPAFTKNSLTSYTVTQHLEASADNYEFRVIVDGAWKGANYTIKRDYCSNVELGADQNFRLLADITGDYIFEFNPQTNLLTVTYPAQKFVVTLTTDGYASFCWDKNWTAPADVKVYIATSRKEDMILIEEVSGVIPAGKGVILKASGAQVTVTATAEDATSLAGNILEGTTAEIDTPTGTIYALHYSSDASATVFDQYLGAKIPANKAYLNLGAGAPARLRVVMAGNTTTGLLNGDASLNAVASKRLVGGQLIILRDGKMYNVQGVQL